MTHPVQVQSYRHSGGLQQHWRVLIKRHFDVLDIFRQVFRDTVQQTHFQVNKFFFGGVTKTFKALTVIGFNKLNRLEIIWAKFDFGYYAVICILLLNLKMPNKPLVTE